MPKIRWIDYQGDQYRLSDLARAHDLAPQTLASRLARGYSISRALATGLCDREEAGRRGFAAGWNKSRA